MRKLHTIACTSLLALLLGGQVQANNQKPSNITGLTQQPPRDIKNADILALSEREQRLWFHGAIAQMTHTLASKDENTARCLLDRFFEEKDQFPLFVKAMKRYPDVAPTAIVLAVARQICPEA